MRVRFRFTKLGKVRFIGHRDVARVWERALRRASLPVATTEGFSPRPRVHFGLALPTGHESLGEYLDVDLCEGEPIAPELEGAGLAQRLTQMLPEGVEVQATGVVSRSDMSLQQAVTSCTWRIEVPGIDPHEAHAEAERLVAAESLVVTRQRKGQSVTDDIRPGLIDLTVAGRSQSDMPTPGTVLVAELGTQPRGIRPSELLGLFSPPREEGRVCRTNQWIMLDGARTEPLRSDATWQAPQVPAERALHAEVRAS